MEKFRFAELENSLLEKSSMPFAIYQFLNKRVVTLVLSKGFCELFGYDDPAKAYYDMDNNMYIDTHPDDAARIADAAFRFATEGGKYDVIYRTKNKNGPGYKIIHAQGEHMYTETGVRLAHVWYIDEGIYNEESDSAELLLNDTLKKALYEESFIKAGYYDHLTGLPSMTYFFELATSSRRSIEANGDRPALLFMDFSGMKYYNHKYGFAAGDALLQDFARLLAKRYGNENCCRMGQDHFAVISKEEGIEDSLRELFEECTQLNKGRSLPLHVGIYLHWFEGIVASMACDRAKFACDTLRNVYSSDFSYYNMSMKDAEDRQQYIIANLDKAIQERWIKVFYQPIVRAVNGRVCDEEALARWIDPIKGYMSPAEFIPVLEDHRLIYKLDLYVVECVLQKIKTLKGAGLNIMPQSINLSRSDFDTCDIVEEIKKRVDAFGISHSMLTIEITESLIGKDFEFMRAQIDRFREQGFAVWMDDFGSGYSSLDVLQSLKFDLIKFDMSFMRKFNESKSRIILTELMNMANSLGIDTVCEGVETAEQVQFLKETGCSKLQGYFFEKPIPVEKILDKYAKGIQIGFENPDESVYYDSIGRVNLHDLSIIAQGDNNEFDKFFNTIPMAVIEVNNGNVRFARSNQSYRDFMYRYFDLVVNDKLEPFHDKPDAAASPFMKAIMQSSKDSNIVFLTEKAFDGSTIHSCLRRIAVNNVSGTFASAVAVLTVIDGEQGTTYANIAKALAADYSYLYYVDIETDFFYQYSNNVEDEDISIERRGEDFFNTARSDALKLIYHEDVEHFLAMFTKENIFKQLNEQGLFTITYRLIVNGEPVYVVMKAMRMQDDDSHIIIGVSNVDAQMKQKIMIDKIRQNELFYSRLMALSGDYICIYSVDPESGDYLEYSSNLLYKDYGFNTGGKQFFEQAYRDSSNVIHPDDRPMFLKQLTKENVLAHIEKDGVFMMQYRLLYQGESVPVILRALVVREDEKDKLIIGVCKAERD
ncbi:diguanylate cyclase (GGDEF) domain-containing protein [Ruminococcaceae bacterium FB2012]|nr:diguanylate cyclase (GGDEF) domain-containing protein [Ruminococcaceae bacterium FB2012]